MEFDEHSSRTISLPAKSYIFIEKYGDVTLG